MLWAVCFFGFLQSGEFTVQSSQQFDATWHLIPRDIAVDSRENPTLMKAHLNGSKTNQMRLGIDSYVCKMESELCPVAAVLAYLVTLDQDDGPLLQWLSTISPDP